MGYKYNTGTNVSVIVTNLLLAELFASRFFYVCLCASVHLCYQLIWLALFVSFIGSNEF